MRVEPANRVNRAAILVGAVKAAVAIAVAVAANAGVLRAGIVVNGAKAARMAATLACRTSLLRKTKFRPKGGKRKGAPLRSPFFLWAAFVPALTGGPTLTFSCSPHPFVDRQSVVWGESVSVRLDLGGLGIIKKK